MDIFYENLKSKLAEKVGAERVEQIESLGLLENTPVVKASSPLDTLCHYLESKLTLGNYI